MKSLDELLKKLDRPPAAQNWVRLNEFGDEIKTAKLIANLAAGMPSFNYAPAVNAICDRIRIGLERTTALTYVGRTGAPAGREQNGAVVQAFYEYDETRGYSRLRAVDSYEGFFPISREVKVPMRPSVTIIENGYQIPIIFCGWKSVALDLNQRRLLMTLLESGLFSYTDYQNSPAEIVFFPETETSEGARRVPEVWKRGDYKLLSATELRDQLATYMRARELARPLIAERWRKRQEQQNREDRRIDLPGSGHPDLFGGA